MRIGESIDPMIPGKAIEIDKEEWHLYRQIARFIGSVKGRCADIGEKNTKMECLKKLLKIDSVDQIDAPDFNECSFNASYDVVFCFEVIEHLQNPLAFMKQVKKLIHEDGVIYLSTPNRPKILWSECHFFEMNPDRITKWIFTPSRLKVIRKKKLWWTYSNWWFYFTGIRPLLRLFFNTKYIYELRYDR